MLRLPTSPFSCHRETVNNLKDALSQGGRDLSQFVTSVGTVVINRFINGPAEDDSLAQTEAICTALEEISAKLPTIAAAMNKPEEAPRMSWLHSTVQVWVNLDKFANRLPETQDITVELEAEGSAFISTLWNLTSGDLKK